MRGLQWRSPCSARPNEPGDGAALYRKLASTIGRDDGNAAHLPRSAATMPEMTRGEGCEMNQEHRPQTAG